MPRRAAIVTQADVARVIRTVQAAGLPVIGVLVRADGVLVQTATPPESAPEPWEPQRQDRAPRGAEIVT